jgi:hypothetical protein
VSVDDREEDRKQERDDCSSEEEFPKSSELMHCLCSRVDVMSMSSIGKLDFVSAQD